MHGLWHLEAKEKKKTSGEGQPIKTKQQNKAFSNQNKGYLRVLDIYIYIYIYIINIYIYYIIYILYTHT